MILRPYTNGKNMVCFRYNFDNLLNHRCRHATWICMMNNWQVLPRSLPSLSKVLIYISFNGKLLLSHYGLYSDGIKEIVASKLGYWKSQYNSNDWQWERVCLQKAMQDTYLSLIGFSHYVWTPFGKIFCHICKKSWFLFLILFLA
jgi:hypothetical protein